MRIIQKILIKLALVIVGLMVLSILLVLSLRWINPLTSAFMLEHAFLSEKDHDVSYQWIDRKDISQEVVLAVIAAEDQRFPEHNGIDYKQLKLALNDYKQGKRLRGASTISQQTAKNLFLWSGRSLFRKGLEFWFTFCMETLLGKQRIMEIYLNIAEFGNGIYGVEAASQEYFDKPAAQLTARESALLAAVLPAPKSYRVDKPSKYVGQRQHWILKQMKNLGNDHIKEL